jgi:hypothetical protein
MEKADVPEEIKDAWLKNRLARLCHHNPKLLPYYLQVAGDRDALRKVYALVELEKLKGESDD